MVADDLAIEDREVAGASLHDAALAVEYAKAIEDDGRSVVNRHNHIRDLAVKGRHCAGGTLVRVGLGAGKSAADYHGLGEGECIWIGEKRYIATKPNLDKARLRGGGRKRIGPRHCGRPAQAVTFHVNHRLCEEATEDVERRHKHLALQSPFSRHRDGRDADSVVVAVDNVEVPTVDVPADPPGLRTQDIRHRELRTVDAAEIVRLVGNRQNHQRRCQPKRNIVQEERCITTRPAIELQRVLSRGQNQAFDASVSDIAARDRLIGIDDLVVKQHLVVHRGVAPVATVLAFPGKGRAARGFAREDLLHGTGMLEHSAIGTGDEGRGLVWLVAVPGIDNKRPGRVRPGPAGLEGAGLEPAVDQELVGVGIFPGQYLALVGAAVLAGRGHGADTVVKAVRRLEWAPFWRDAALGKDPVHASLPVCDREARLRLNAGPA